MCCVARQQSVDLQKSILRQGGSEWWGKVGDKTHPGERRCQISAVKKKISILSFQWQSLSCALWANRLVSLSFSFSKCNMGKVEIFIPQQKCYMGVSHLMNQVPWLRVCTCCLQQSETWGLSGRMKPVYSCPLVKTVRTRQVDICFCF